MEFQPPPSLRRQLGSSRRGQATGEGAEEQTMAEHNLTARMAAQMDRHLVLLLLEFLQERQLYPRDELLQDKLSLLANTNMVNYAMDIHKTLHATDDVPADMLTRRSDVVARLEALHTAAAPLLALLLNPHPQQGKQQFNRDMQLQKRFHAGQDQIEALYQYAKFQFECGGYPAAAASLHLYLALCNGGERNRRLSAMWGMLAAEILLRHWDVAQQELDRLKETIDSKDSSSPTNQPRSRVWLMHWSLFIFFNHKNGMNGIVDLFFQDYRYLNAIQMNAPHLLRYLAAALVVNKRRRSMLTEFIRVFIITQQCYRDPITEFLECLYVRCDLPGAQLKLMECEQVILNDPFLGKRVDQGSSNIVPFRHEFVENARLLIFEACCRIHRRVDIGMLAQKMNMEHDEAELWMMNLVRSSKIDAKIDSVAGSVIMTTDHVDVHEQIVERMMSLNVRSYMLAKSILEPSQASQQPGTENLQF